VFDVGFNIGQDTAFYLAEGHRVVAIEADPTLAAKGRQRFASEVRTGQLTIVNVGIAEREGEAQFWICEGKPELTRSSGRSPLGMATRTTASRYRPYASIRCWRNTVRHIS